MNKDWIVIKGARENNLKHIDVNVPRDKFVIMTGVSVPERHRWRSIRSMRKDSGGMWSR